jgi:uncharacterized protein with FMN-binding domain
MKKIVYALLATVSGLVLMFSYRTSHIETIHPVAADTSTASSAPDSSGDDAATGGSDGTGTSPGTGTDSDSSGSGASGTDSGATSESSATGLVDGIYTGASADTRFGPVQVQITVSDGRITDVQVPEYPANNPRDRQINQRAVPVLVSETTTAQSAEIDMVSGATYTSQGYLTSLQSAIDQARA